MYKKTYLFLCKNQSKREIVCFFYDFSLFFKHFVIKWIWAILIRRESKKIRHFTQSEDWEKHWVRKTGKLKVEVRAMISNQILQSTIDGLKNITRSVPCV